MPPRLFPPIRDDKKQKAQIATVIIKFLSTTNFDLNKNIDKNIIARIIGINILI
jgi:hypothetical protein